MTSTNSKDHDTGSDQVATNNKNKSMEVEEDDVAATTTPSHSQPQNELAATATTSPVAVGEKRVKKQSNSKRESGGNIPMFPVGPAGKRELRNVLKVTMNPIKTITEFQQSHSLHTMMAKANQTIPISKYKVTTRSRSSMNTTGSTHTNSATTSDGTSSTNSTPTNVESLDTDSVMTFLSHLGISQHFVHKRITDALLHELCDMIRHTSNATLASTASSTHNNNIKNTATTTLANSNTSTTEDTTVVAPTNSALYDLLKSCWVYTTTISELRPILWTILKQLGHQTPIPVLLALTERADTTTTAPTNTTTTAVKNETATAAAASHNDEQIDLQNTTTSTKNTQISRIKLKHAEIFKPLSLSLKQLCWEVDWEHYIPFDYSYIPDPHDFLTVAQTTLLYDTIQNDIDEYVQNPVLCDMANHPFVTSISERRIMTTQRRALTTASTAAMNHKGLKPTPLGTVSGSNLSSNSSKTLATGKAVSHLRHLLCSAGGSKNLSGTTTGTSSATGGGGSNSNTATMTYRPKLLYSVLSILMAKYCTSGSNTSTQHDAFVIGGAQHLYCTLVADILLLSAGGPLPKPYNDILTLARTLDDIVQEATISDSNLYKLQSVMKLIFQPDQVNDVTTTGTNAGVGSPMNKAKEMAAPTVEMDEPSSTVQRQLNRFILAGLISMKECDPQNLFLNPVTDQIAPGYSAIIKQPMSIITMEHKLKQNQYRSVGEWENDVTLMFKNCINYNRGPAGAWFRNEANRQAKIFREETFPKAKRLYQNEIAKRNFISSSTIENRSGIDNINGSTSTSGLKRPANGIDIEIVPLQPSMKKRKKEREEHIPSMPALASMLLADPFVVRIIIARLLLEFRRSVIPGQTVPCSNVVAPSLLQLLHIVRYSKDICAMRGKKYFIPPAGFDEVENNDETDPTAIVSYTCLRHYVPLLVRLLFESEFDRRITLGGDLHPASQSTSIVPIPPFLSSIHSWMDNTEQKAYVAIVLLQGSIVHLCLPGHHTDTSLSITLPKFASALQEIVSDASAFLQDRTFFNCLQEAILRHRTKLPRSARDAIVTVWLGWLQEGGTCALTSPAHECLIKLINDWYALGNVLLPRDVMIRYCSNIIETVNTSTNKFATLWQQSVSKIKPEFVPIKKQYEHMLKLLPEPSAAQWIEHHGLGSEEPAITEVAD